MSVPCPCCGRPIVDDGVVRIDVAGGFIVAGDQVTRLTGREFEMFQLLWEARPRMVSREQLMQALYWRRSSGEEVEIKIVDVFACKIRKRLKPLGLGIDTVWGQGYRILLGQEAT